MRQQAIEKICDQVSRPYRKRHGMAVVGYLDCNGLTLHVFRNKSDNTDGMLESVTLFEIGSVTKTFTAALMCELEIRGQIKLDQPISNLLSGFGNLPDWITPHSLATHTSGLPRIPDGMNVADSSNPYRMIDEPMLQEWVQSRASFAPRTAKMAYSNLGMGLLGLALGKATGCSFEDALHRFILAPLGMENTFSKVPEALKPQVAQPHGLFGKKVPIWDFDALAGCGALKSSALDMAVYARAVIDACNGKSGPAMDAIRNACRMQIKPEKPFEMAMCYGWLCMTEKRTQLPVYHHDGGTGGSSSTLFVCPGRGFAIFVLANTQTTIWTSFRQIIADPMGALSKATALADNGETVN